MFDERRLVSRSHRNLLVVTSVVTFLLITLGGIVCATHASGGCPDWPRCQGRLVPPLQMNALIEYTHRVVALLTGILITTTAVVGWRKREAGRALRVLPTIAVALTAAVAVFGAFAVLTGLSPVLAAVDLGTALIVLALVVATAALACVPHDQPHVALRPPSPSALATLALVTLGTVFSVVVMGVLVANGSVMRCLGGPLHLGTWAAIGAASWQHTPRQMLAVIAGCLVLALPVVAVRRGDVDSVTRRWTIVCCILFLVGTLLSLTMIAVGPTTCVLIGSAVLTAGMWSALVVVAVRARLLSGSRTAEAAATAQTTVPVAQDHRGS